MCILFYLHVLLHYILGKKRNNSEYKQDISQYYVFSEPQTFFYEETLLQLPVGINSYISNCY